MREDRFFLGILIGIGLMVIVALIVFFSRPTTVRYVSDGTAAGVVQDYITALYARDFDRAYAFLAEADDKVSLETFRTEAEFSLIPSLNNTTVDVGPEEVSSSGNSAVVPITILRGGGVLDSADRSLQEVQLTRQDGDWKITWAPDPLWIYGWMTPSTPEPKLTPTTTP